MRKRTIATQSPESIRKALERIESVSAAIRGLVKAMESHGVTRVVVKHQAALERAMQDLVRWRNAIEEAVNEKLIETGAFCAASDDVPEAGEEGREKARTQSKKTTRSSRNRS